MLHPLEIRLDRQSFAGVAIGTSGERAPVIRSGEREPISRLVRQLVYSRDSWKCQHCGAHPYPRDPHRQSGALHLDHIVPWSAGGSDRSDNLRTLCGACNEKRSNFVSQEDRPSMPVVGICTPCLSFVDARVAALWEASTERFDVYCGSRHHIGWAIPGWHLL